MKSHFVKPKSLYYFSLFTAFFTLLLIAAGSLVMSTGAGLTIPTWPLPSNLFPPFKGVLWFEYGHRILAGTDSILTILLAFLIFKFNFEKPVKWLGLTAVAAIISQALLGGITVLYGLPFDASTAHAALAQIFFCIMVSIAYFTSPFTVKQGVSVNKVLEKRIVWLKRLTLITPLLIYVQILMGAFVRHLDAGLAISTFPLAFGHFFPPGSDLSFRVLMNFLHTRIGGFFVLIFVLETSWLGLSFPNLKTISQVNFILVFLQILLGIGIVLTGKETLFTTFHVAFGALLLALNFLLAIKVRVEFNFAPSAAAKNEAAVSSMKG
jgi:cytochrome c oxidase assembly protein subunit 15